MGGEGRGGDRVGERLRGVHTHTYICTRTQTRMKRSTYTYKMLVKVVQSSQGGWCTRRSASTMRLHHPTNKGTHVVQLVDDKLTVAGVVLPMGNTPLQWLEEGMVHLQQGRRALNGGN